MDAWEAQDPDPHKSKKPNPDPRNCQKNSLTCCSRWRGVVVAVVLRAKGGKVHEAVDLYHYRSLLLLLLMLRDCCCCFR
jgi:hypothetical protein